VREKPRGKGNRRKVCGERKSTNKEKIYQLGKKRATSAKHCHGSVTPDQAGTVKERGGKRRLVLEDALRQKGGPSNPNGRGRKIGRRCLKLLKNSASDGGREALQEECDKRKKRSGPREA